MSGAQQGKFFDGLGGSYSYRYCHLEFQLGWNILNDITHMRGPQLGWLEQLGTGLASLSLQGLLPQSSQTS